VKNLNKYFKTKSFSHICPYFIPPIMWLKYF